MNDSHHDVGGTLLRKVTLAITFTWMVSFPLGVQAEPTRPAAKDSKGERIIFYHQTEYADMCSPGTGFRSLSSLWKNLNPATRRPYATHVILAAFNMGPTAENPKKLAPYIHRNDFPINDPIHKAVRKELKTLQGKGVRVLMMLGGAGAPVGGQKCDHPYDNDTWGALQRDWNTYYGFIKSTLETYELDGIDLNVEHPNLGADNLIKLIRQLRTDFAGRRTPLIITLAPVANELWGEKGFSRIDYAEVYRQVGSQIDWINGQFYEDYSGLPTPDAYRQAATYQGGVYPPEKLVMGTLMDYVTSNYDTVSGAVQELGKGPFGGVAMWEYYGTPKSPVQWSSDMYRAMNAGRAKPRK
jgi:hypothetical protein